MSTFLNKVKNQEEKIKKRRSRRETKRNNARIARQSSISKT
jgi:hypothetical protein